MHTKDLTNDAKAILLLCGRFGKSDVAKPFSLGEYNQLADWMRYRSLRPADLLTDAGAKMLEKGHRDIDKDRVKRLISRGAAMALAIEKWTNTGLWVICRSDAHYPERLKQHLKKLAPPILYGVGDIDLLNGGGLAVVGSRNVDAQGEMFTRRVAEECARLGIQIVSGGARGVDQIAMLAALNAGGNVVGILADGLLKSAVAKKYRDGIREKRLVLVSPFSPDARFHVGNAMGRNKHIYAIADFGLIISAEVEKGGTWAGATEELRREDPRPVFVRDEAEAPKGNLALIHLGAQPFPQPPWGADLVPRLSTRREAKRMGSGKQISLFGETPPMAPAASSVKEETSDYPVNQVPDVKEAQHAEEVPARLPTSIFEAVLPVLLNALTDWRPPKELAEALGVRKPQVDDWLNRGVEEGRIEKKNRPVRYRRID